MTKREEELETKIMRCLIIGFVFLAIAGFAYGIWLECATPTVTPAGPNCVIIQKGFQKSVRCFANVDVNTEAR